MPDATLPPMRTNRFALALSLAPLLLAALSPLTADAAQWKWRDSAGRVQYSDRPPPAGTRDQDILTRPSGSRALTVAAPASDVVASAPPPPAVKASDPELEARKRKADEEKQALQKAEEQKRTAARADNCQRARKYQRTLDDGIRISRTTATGEREVLDDRARAAEQVRNRQTLDANCR